MKHKITITAIHREPVDLDKLAQALLAIVDDLDESTRARLAKEGKRLYKEMTEGGRAAGKKKGAA